MLSWFWLLAFALLFFGAAFARWGEGGVVYGLIALVATPINLRKAFAKVEARPSGIRVVNTLSSFDLAWEEIDRFEIGRWRWASAVLLAKTRSGALRPAFAVGEVRFCGGSPARRIAAELNAELRLRLGHGGPEAGGPGTAQAELFGRSS